MEAPTTSITATRRHCFIDSDQGLHSSIVEMESAGFSGNHHHVAYHHPLGSRTTVVQRRRGSMRNMANFSSSGFAVCTSPRYGRVYDSRFEDVYEHLPHFLEACSLCSKHLNNKCDIYMYRGDTPFCSEECRQEQIEADESKEKKWSLSASMKAMRRSQVKDSSAQKSSSSSSSTYRTAGTTIAAA